MTPQFGASLADDSRVVIYDCNIFIVQATGSRDRIQTHDLGIMSEVFYHIADLPGQSLEEG